MAAAALIVAVIRSNDHPKYQVARVAPSQPTPAPAVEPEPKKLESAPRRAPPRSPRVLREPANSTVTGSLDAPTAPPPQATSAPPPPPQPAPAIAGRIQAFREERQSLQAAAFLRYSLAKRDDSGAYSALPPNVPPQPGDAVRLNIVSAVPGYLTLYQLDSAGDWKRLFPAVDQGLFVAPNATTTIPDSAIIVTDMEQKFRFTLQPMDGAPLTVDITIGPGKIP